mmetsp:Transcript_36537/g.91997  ORF Transcript_36537/g.91997 Transcript_36537/m.91997 type:complete len:231 (+) Transcript_36537:777-1469(+)
MTSSRSSAMRVGKPTSLTCAAILDSASESKRPSSSFASERSAKPTSSAHRAAINVSNRESSWSKTWDGNSVDHVLTRSCKSTKSCLSLLVSSQTSLLAALLASNCSTWKDVIFATLSSKDSANSLLNVANSAPSCSICVRISKMSLVFCALSSLSLESPINVAVVPSSCVAGWGWHVGVVAVLTVSSPLFASGVAAMRSTKRASTPSTAALKSRATWARSCSKEDRNSSI